MRNWIMVEDGATIVVLAKTNITMNDPADEFPFVAQAYRIVADRTAPTLVLVPLAESPKKLRVDETPHDLLEHQRFVIERATFPPCGGLPPYRDGDKDR